MDPDFMSQVLQELGLGTVPPIFNESNKRAHQDLIAKQLEIAKYKALNGKANDSIARLFGHVTNIQESLTETKHLNVARREAESSERDLLRVAQLYSERNNRDSRELGKVSEKLHGQNEQLREDVATRAAINQLMEDEYRTDLETVLKWTGDVDDYEEDIMSILKFQLKDEIRIKETHLKLEKLRLKVKQSKALLDMAATDSRMAQLGLDKTAEEFRVLHHERQVAIGKWQEATDLIAKRDEELQAIFNNVNDVKSAVRDQEGDLQEQLTFLANEKNNLTELERLIADLERKSRHLNETLEEREKDLEELDSEVTIEKRQIWRIGSEIHSKRSKLNRMKKDLRKKVTRCEQLSLELELARSKKLHTGSMAMSAEDRAKEMQQLLDREENQLNGVQFELDKLREKKVSKEKVLKDLLTNEEANNLRLHGLGLEIKNLTKKGKLTKAELAKKEDIAIANNYTLSQIERELAQLRGTQSEVNRSKLKESIDQCKLELENRNSDKRNLDHLVHKMASDVRKVRRDIDAINVQQDRIRVSLEKVTVINESCEKEQKKLEEKLELLLMEQKMMKLTEKKAKEDLEELNNDLLELRKEDLEVNEKLLEQRADAESKREVYASQLRCLKDELGTIRGEIRDRKDRVEKLKIRHDLAIQALGDAEANEKGEKIPTHARHLVVIAQEKAELMDQSEILSNRIEKEEKELEGLEQAMAMLKSSNDQYRETNLRNNSNIETEEITALRDQVYSRERQIKKIKNRIAELTDDLNQSEYLIQKAEKEMSNLKQLKEDKTTELLQVERDLADQEKKVMRAQRMCSGLSKEMKDKVANGDIFETDMNLRAEKEKQRAALIKLREISSIDPDFSKACQRELDSLGLTLPVASRLELMSATTSHHSNRSSATNPRTSGSSVNSSVRNSFFRQRSQSGNEGMPSKVSAHTSVLVMDLNEAIRPQPLSKSVKLHTLTA